MFTFPNGAAVITCGQREGLPSLSGGLIWPPILAEFISEATLVSDSKINKPGTLPEFIKRPGPRSEANRIESNRNFSTPSTASHRTRASSILIEICAPRRLLSWPIYAHDSHNIPSSDAQKPNRTRDKVLAQTTHTAAEYQVGCLYRTDVDADADADARHPSFHAVARPTDGEMIGNGTIGYLLLNRRPSDQPRHLRKLQTAKPPRIIHWTSPTEQYCHSNKSNPGKTNQTCVICQKQIRIKSRQ